MQLKSRELKKKVRLCGAWGAEGVFAAFDVRITADVCSECVVIHIFVPGDWFVFLSKVSYSLKVQCRK